jgi:hypothetical protein
MLDDGTSAMVLFGSGALSAFHRVESNGSPKPTQNVALAIKSNNNSLYDMHIV